MKEDCDHDDDDDDDDDDKYEIHVLWNCFHFIFTKKKKKILFFKT